MGLASPGPDTIYLGTPYQIWRLENAPPRGDDQKGYDRGYVACRVWTRGT